MESCTKNLFFVHIEQKKCIACSKCVNVCFSYAIVGRYKSTFAVISSECNGCAKCISYCVLDAIKFFKNKKIFFYNNCFFQL